MPTYDTTVWTTWVTTGSNSTISTWNYWNAGTAVTNQQYIWSAWNGTTAIGSTYRYTPYQASAAELEARAERERAALAEAERVHFEQQKAAKKARRLLRRHLNAAQKEELNREDAFRVIVGDRTYRIKRGWAGNVELLDDAGAVESLCIHPVERVPDEDNMLAQKLLLEHDEAEFRRIANITRLRRTG